MIEGELKYSPIYGYATKEQYEELQQIGIGPRRDYLMKEIEKQTKKKGRLKDGK